MGTQTHKRGDREKPQGEDDRLFARKTGLRRNRPCKRLDLGLLFSKAVRQYILVVEAPEPWSVVVASLAAYFRGAADYFCGGPESNSFQLHQRVNIFSSTRPQCLLQLPSPRLCWCEGAALGGV